MSVYYAAMPDFEPKRPWKVRLTPPTVDHYQKWVEKAKSHRMISAALVAFAVILGVAQLSGILTTIWNVVRSAFPSSTIELGTNLYVLDVADQPSTNPPELFEEVRHIPSGCRIYRSPLLPNLGGQWASPGDDGARATLLLKLFIGNTSGQKLSKVQLLMSPAKTPFEFTTIFSTPNALASMERRKSAQGGAQIYVLNVDSVASDDFVVLTLVSKLSQENAKQALKGDLGLNIISLRADQLNTAKLNIKRSSLGYLELYLLEGQKTTGNLGFDMNSEIRISNKSRRPTAREFAFLPPARDCPS